MLSNFLIAIDAVIANKVRSLLTALGIIFGVAAVIAMMAIGDGAREEILNQIKLVGVNNIVIKPIIEQKEEKVEEKTGKEEKNKFSPGLTIRDVASIKTASMGTISFFINGYKRLQNQGGKDMLLRFSFQGDMVMVKS